MGSEDGDIDCPICCNELDLTDRSIQYCQCGFQPCLWCYHHILEEASKENLPARCPNCRSEYDQANIRMQHIDAEQLEEEKKKLRERDKPKGGAGAGGAGGSQSGSARTFNRANLANVRVVQPNLVYAVGLPLDICDEDILKQSEFFGQYGKTVKISVNRSNQYASALAKHGPTGSAYVTFRRSEDALKCIKGLDGSTWRGKPIKACFGTTKYCNAFLKGVSCNNPDCLYLHDLADEGDCLTKEEVAAGLLPARFLAMGATNTFRPRLTINSIPNAATAAAQAAAAAAVAAGQPRAAIEAAAAAAGGVDRAQQQTSNPNPTSAPTTTSTRILTIPASSLRSAGAQKVHSHQPQGPLQQASDGASSAGSSAPTGSPSRVFSNATAAPNATSKSQWGTAGHIPGHGDEHGVFGVPPPPPSDKQEWPTLGPTGASQGNIAAHPSSETEIDIPSVDGSRSGAMLLGRAPSMAEQLARAHSNASESKSRTKKLVSLSSPGKMKPLGKAPSGVLRPVSPHDSNALASGAVREEPLQPLQKRNSSIHENLENEATENDRHAEEAPKVVAGTKAISDKKIGVGAMGGPVVGAGQETSQLPRRPPPGFGDLRSLNSCQQPQPLQQQQGNRQVTPPPGFASLASSAPARNSSYDNLVRASLPTTSGNEPLERKNSGFLPFDGLSGNIVGGAGSLLGQLSISESPSPLPSGNQSTTSSLLTDGPGGQLQQRQNIKQSCLSTAFVPSLSRRQKSRFAFAQTEDEDDSGPVISSDAGLRAQNQQEMRANAVTSTHAFNNYTSGGVPLHTRLAGPPETQLTAVSSPQTDGAGAFFKSLFPSANITVLDQPSHARSGRITDNVNAGSADMNGTFQSGPEFGQAPFDSSFVGSPQLEQRTNGAVSPGLALLRQLQNGEGQQEQQQQYLKSNSNASAVGPGDSALETRGILQSRPANSGVPPGF